MILLFSYGSWPFLWSMTKFKGTSMRTQNSFWKQLHLWWQSIEYCLALLALFFGATNISSRRNSVGEWQSRKLIGGSCASERSSSSSLLLDKLLRLRRVWYHQKKEDSNPCPVFLLWLLWDLSKRMSMKVFCRLWCPVTKQGIIVSMLLGNAWNFLKMFRCFNITGVDHTILLARVKDSTAIKEKDWF